MNVRLQLAVLKARIRSDEVVSDVMISAGRNSSIAREYLLISSLSFAHSILAIILMGKMMSQLQEHCS